VSNKTPEDGEAGRLAAQDQALRAETSRAVQITNTNPRVICYHPSTDQEGIEVSQMLICATGGRD